MNSSAWRGIKSINQEWIARISNEMNPSITDTYTRNIPKYFPDKCPQWIFIYDIRSKLILTVSLKIPQNVISRWALGMILKQRKISITRCRFKVSRHRNCIFQSGYDLVERGTLVVGSSSSGRWKANVRFDKEPKAVREAVAIAAYGSSQLACSEQWFKMAKTRRKLVNLVWFHELFHASFGIFS